MFNDELFQKIARTPGLTCPQLAEYFGANPTTIRRKLQRLEKYDVLTTLQVPNPKGRGRATIKAYYPSEEGLKYVKKEETRE
jgi:predicted ArsR family transcriptional regulator